MNESVEKILYGVCTHYGESAQVDGMPVFNTLKEATDYASFKEEVINIFKGNIPKMQKINYTIVQVKQIKEGDKNYGDY